MTWFNDVVDMACVLDMCQLNCRSASEMGDDFSVEIYGVLSAETQEMCSSLAFPVKHYVSHLGYSRLSGIQTSL